MPGKFDLMMQEVVSRVLLGEVVAICLSRFDRIPMAKKQAVRYFPANQLVEVSGTRIRHRCGGEIRFQVPTNSDGVRGFRTRFILDGLDEGDGWRLETWGPPPEPPLSRYERLLRKDTIS